MNTYLNATAYSNKQLYLEANAQNVQILKQDLSNCKTYDL